MKNKYLLALCVIGLAGCTTAYQSDKITILKERVFGLKVVTSSLTANGLPDISLGSSSTVFALIPTSTNNVNAPKYMDTYRMNQSINPFDTSFHETFGSGDVYIGGTNDTSKAIIPSPYVAPYYIAAPLTNSVSK